MSRREPAIDFLSARAARLQGVADADVLALAAEQGRILVTHDFQTMPNHFGEFLAGGHSSPGVFLVKQRTPVAHVIDELLLIWLAPAFSRVALAVLVSPSIEGGGQVPTDRFLTSSGIDALTHE